MSTQESVVAGSDAALVRPAAVRPAWPALRHLRLSIWAWVSVAATCGFVLATVAYARWHSFGSDDVAIQNIVQSVLSGQPLQPAIGNDNFIVKTPIYAVVGALLPNTTTTLVITTLLCNAPLVAALLVIGHAVLRNATAVRQIAGGALICGYLASQLADVAPTMQANGRNGEIGVALLLLWWRTAAGVPRRVRGILASVLAVAAWVTLFFSDLFFLFVLVPVAVVVAVITVVLDPRRVRVLVAMAELVLAGGIGYWLLGRAQAAGFVISQNFTSGTPTAAELPGSVVAALAAVGRDLNADVWGRPLGLPLLPSLVQLGFTVAVLALAVFAVARGRAWRHPRVLLAAVVVLVNLALYVLTGNAADTFSFRYVFLATAVLLLLALRGIAALPRIPAGMPLRAGRLGFAAAVGVAAFGLIVNAAAIARSGGATDPQERTHRIVALAEARGAMTGVGAYWDGNVTTWFSQYRVRVVPQTCTPDGITPYAWLINFPEMRVTGSPSFVVLNASAGCTAGVVRSVYGTPSGRDDLPGGDQIWFYDRAITP